MCLETSKKQFSTVGWSSRARIGLFMCLERWRKQFTPGFLSEEHGPDWSHQVSAVAATLWLQRDQTLPLCKECGLRD